MKNWKTTVAGLILACAMGVSQAPAETPGVPKVAREWASFAAVISAGMLGIWSKDNNVTGGTKKQN